MTSHKIGIVMGGYLDEKSHLMDRSELNRRIALKDAEIKRLKSRDLFLQCLEECGVDNWHGYSEACDLEKEYLKEEENE